MRLRFPLNVVLVAGLQLDAASALATTLSQSGQYLTLGMNDGATLSDGAAALSYDTDGSGYLPAIRVLVPDTALERFTLRFTSSGQTVTLANEAPPGTTQATFALSDTSSGTTSSTDASLTFNNLRVRQRSSFSSDGRALTLTISLSNLGSSPLTDVQFLRAVNPDPDLEHQGQAVTVDDLVHTDDGDLALASGPVSGLTVSLGVRDHTAATGFCYRCSDPSSVPYDSAGRLEDWDLVTIIPVSEIAPGTSISFSLVYLVSPSADAALADWAALFDHDGDTVSSTGGDCDDTRDDVYPGALELCDGVDQDCDGQIDDGTECGDDDGDGYAELDGDCDDADATRHPGASEGEEGDAGLEPDGVDNDCDGLIDEGTVATDDDGDGVTERAGDCDDDDPAAYPGAAEVSYDGIDQDCDGADLIDVDGDGFDAPAAGGTDCDDARPEVYPDAPELEDALDNDCDGLADEDFVVPGDVLITEILYDPGAVADRSGEFFELYNASGGLLDLRGWTLANSAGQSLALDPAAGITRLEAGDYLVLGVNGDTTSNGGLEVDYPYTGLTLANSADRLSIRVGALEIDAVAWDGGATFPDPSGASIQLDPDCLDATANDDGACWCVSQTPWGEGTDLGSPGAANPQCLPPPPPDADGDGFDGPDAGGPDCDDQDPDIYPGAPEIPYDGIDQDCDGGDPDDLDGDSYVAEEAGGTDCDDDDPDVHLGALETPYDGVDQDCDGDDLIDADQDGYAGLEADGPDCDDADPAIHPGADEDGGSGSGEPDGIDQDCDGVVDNATSVYDDDGDGYSETAGDCDDAEAGVYPGAPELEDGVDNDCDGAIDPAWTDQDGDLYAPADGDCDDGDASIHPEALELRDGIDQDCDGLVDDGTEDFDDDGDGFSEAQGDCDDAHADLYPGATDRCGDGIDQDCNGEADTGCYGGCGCSSTADEPVRGGWLAALISAVVLLARKRQ